jgi:3-oxoacyl-[acyl-carrier protein] reductase
VVAADGRSVAVPYGHDRRAAMETLADIETNGGSGFAISADLTDPDAAETL